MNDVIIRVENLSKRYLLSHQAGQSGGAYRYRRFSDVLLNAAKAPWRKLAGFRADSRKATSTTEEFWALRNVSFEVERGEVVGIIGRNGAGKSTLLKILSRITSPTTGRAELEGRVASLLEVGTGFHPELTGRENIFLNGAVLGMPNAEIKRKFDEIVDFAEIEKFLDTPVKRYSSGMYVRLAFAVAAHLEPEILIVDEVLAVGDAEFQKKCLGKMQDVASKEGRTVLFVSHNMSAVERLCNKSVLLRKGQIEFQGPTQQVIARYSQSSQAVEGMVIFHAPNAADAYRDARILSISTIDRNGACKSEFGLGEPFSVAIEFTAGTLLREGVIGCQIRTPLGTPLFTSHWNDTGPAKDILPGRHSAVCRIVGPQLMPGTYFVEAGIADRAVRVIDLRTEELSFTVTHHSEGSDNPPINGRPGHLYFDLTWDLDP